MKKHLTKATQWLLNTSKGVIVTIIKLVFNLTLGYPFQAFNYAMKQLNYHYYKDSLYILLILNIFIWQTAFFMGCDFKKELEMKPVEASIQTVSRESFKKVAIEKLEEPTIEAVSSTIREVTMYSSTPEQCDTSPCVGATGEDICELWENGINICATNAFPKGTMLEVEHLGVCIVKDRMNSRFANRIDWYAGFDTMCLDGIQTGDDCPNYQRALKFGKQNLVVKVLK